jgi:membrane protease YdiL (CAAX protease family)
MHDSNQAPPPDPDDLPSRSAGAPLPTVAGPTEFELSPLPPEIRSDERGLSIWLGIVAAAFVASAVFGQAELGLLTALGGMFAVAHAVDSDERWTLLHNFLAWIPPVSGALMFAGIAWFLSTATLTPAERMAGIVSSIVAGALLLLLLVPPLTDALAKFLFRSPDTRHTTRLGARLVAIGFLLTVPGWLMLKGMAAGSDLDPLALGTSSFIGSLIGFTMLSLGAVGFLIGRDLKETAARLGLRRFAGRDVLAVVLGVFAILALNVAMEWFAQRFAPEAFARDQAMNELIAGRLTRVETLLLGVSAGVGEELAMRGALQPRFGLIGTSLLFAVLHVQYSPLGILTIAALGMLLGLIRKRTSTSTAIAVHVLYDIVAALGIQHG